MPYVLILNGKVWATPSAVTASVDVSAVESAMEASGIPAQVYRGAQQPVYAALAFVNYLNANIQYQDIPAVQRSVQSFLASRIGKKICDLFWKDR